MVNKKDFAIRKIYLSYCYKRDRGGGGGGKKDTAGERNVWMLPSLFDLEDVHCAAGIFISKLGRLAMRLAMRVMATKLTAVTASL